MSGAVPSMPVDLKHDWSGLMALVEATAARQLVPCRNGRDVPHGHWTSSDAKERAAAATECQRCPVIVQCRAYGIDHYAESGVLGGLTDPEREQAAKEIRNRKASA